MDLFKEIDDLSDLFLLEKKTKLDSAVEGYEDLQSRYSSLHEDYAKEIENSKKVGKCLVKCLKFYSKLCKKYEAQQKVISRLEETIKEKIISLEEAQRNEEKMKGLIEVYRSERTFYVGQTISDLRKDKEILLDICCRLIGEPIRNNNIRNLTNLLLRKFKKDLDDEKINLLKRKNLKQFKNESECDAFGDVKSSFMSSLKNEVNFKTEEKFSQEMGEVAVPEPEEVDAKNDPLDLSVYKAVSEANQHPEESRSPACEEIGPNQPEFVSSLPLLEDPLPPPEPLCTELENRCEPNVSVNRVAENSRFQETVTKSTEAALQVEAEDCNPEVSQEESTGTPPESGNDSIVTPNLESEAPVPIQEEPPFVSAAYSGSIFDVSDGSLNTADLKTEAEEEEYARLGSELEFGYLCSGESKLNQPPSANKADNLEVNLRNSEEEPDEEELFKIVREMSSVRLPSPVREISDSLGDVMREGKSRNNLSRDEPAQKKRSAAAENPCKNKKLRTEESASGSLLDSIMSAMSLQNEEFRSKGSATGETEGGAESAAGEETCRFSSLGTRTYSRKKKLDGGNSKENSSSLRQSPRTKQNRQKEMEKLVMEAIKNFVSSPILCKEDADGNVKHCLSVLSSKPEDVIARCIVATVLENVDEAVESFERPAPPLTKTQHRLIVLLSVFRTLDSNSEKISTSILSIILRKLFPDNFFWPDDSVEAATRFYAALCKARNDPKTLWRFCLQSMTDMSQRCPLLVFTALKTWPDVLHDATTLKNNLLAVTLVNIFLHMPKTEGLRNFNQGRKLIALKHLLMNFYQFKVEDTIEGYAKKILDAVNRQEAGADKSVALLCRCRGAGWTMKHVMPLMKATLSDWYEEKAEDEVAVKILSVMKQICPVLVQESTDEAKVKDLVHCLSEILLSGKKNHSSEVNIIEVLLQLKQFPEARKVIREWIPKNPIDECLRSEIINASADNILRELMLNKKKEAKSLSLRKRLKQKSKKSKGKKKKGKKRKKNEHVTQAKSVGANS